MTLTLLLYVYLAIGFFYALYILLFAGDPWYSFPINLLGGPIIIVYHIFLLISGKRLPFQD